MKTSYNIGMYLYVTDNNILVVTKYICMYLYVTQALVCVCIATILSCCMCLYVTTIYWQKLAKQLVLVFSKKVTLFSSHTSTTIGHKLIYTKTNVLGVDTFDME